MVIGLCLIATGKYDVFLQPLIDSIDKFFFRNNNVVIYLFTDKTSLLIKSDRIEIINIMIEHKPFPYPTLYRYKHFTNAKNLIDCDYVFYSDVDMKFVDYVDREILPDKKQLITAVLHPGFYRGGGSWCVNEYSRAYTVNKKNYYAGGFQGGERNKFIEVCGLLANNISKDEEKGIIAEWHDESHWNSYLSKNYFKELTPSYCYPESWTLPFPKKILALDKNHAELRK